MLGTLVWQERLCLRIQQLLTRLVSAAGSETQLVGSTVVIIGVIIEVAAGLWTIQLSALWSPLPLCRVLGVSLWLRSPAWCLLGQMIARQQEVSVDHSVPSFAIFGDDVIDWAAVVTLPFFHSVNLALPIRPDFPRPTSRCQVPNEDSVAWV